VPVNCAAAGQTLAAIRRKSKASQRHKAGDEEMERLDFMGGWFQWMSRSV
jgi:hypothetical protein